MTFHSRGLLKKSRGVEEFLVFRGPFYALLSRRIKVVVSLSFDAKNKETSLYSLNPDPGVRHLLKLMGKPLFAEGASMTVF